MEEFKGASGVKIKINPAGFEEAMNLRMAITKELANAKFELSQASLNDVDLAEFARLALIVDSSKEVNSALFACLGRCTYGGERITQATFEEVSAREDYYNIVISCLRVNLFPFFKGLISRLSPLVSGLKQAKDTLK